MQHEASCDTQTAKRASMSRWAMTAPALLFVGLNSLDFVLTRLLLTWHDGAAYEANPLAARVLEAHGWWGLGAYKVGLMGLALAILFAVFSRRPRTCLTVLWGGCLVLAAVAGYSGSHFGERSSESHVVVDAHSACLDEAEVERQREQSVDERRRFGASLEALASQLQSRRMTLAESTQTLGREVSGMAFDPVGFDKRTNPGLDQQGYLSAALIRKVGFMVRHTADAEEQFQRLAKEFRTLNQQEVPQFVRVCFMSTDTPETADAKAHPEAVVP